MKSLGFSSSLSPWNKAMYSLVDSGVFVVGSVSMDLTGDDEGVILKGVSSSEFVTNSFLTSFILFLFTYLSIP